MRGKKIYLGDSVYAVYDGYHIILTTENGIEGDPSNTIYLDGYVLSALKNLVDKINNEEGKHD